VTAVWRDVQRAGWDPRRLPQPPERVGELLRANRAPDLVAEHEVAVLVRGAGEVAFQQLDGAVTLKRFDCDRVERDGALTALGLRRAERAAARGRDQLLRDLQVRPVKLKRPPRQPE
jgi:hypothetical protein